MRIILGGCCFCCACRRPVDVRSMLGVVVAALLLLGYVIDRVWVFGGGVR